MSPQVPSHSQPATTPDKKGGSPSRQSALLLVLALAVMFFPFWARGEVFVAGDFLTFIYPWRAVSEPKVHNLDLLDVAVFFYPQDVFYNAELAQNNIPLWNPAIFNGHPTVASGQSALLYPPRLLAHKFLHPAVAKTILLMLHLGLTGVFTYGWLRGRNLSVPAASLGSSCWTFNTFTMGMLELDHIAYMSPYLPAMLWSFDRRRWPLMAVAGALCLQAGHLQMAFYLGFVVAFYILVGIWLEKRHRVQLLGGILASGIGVILLSAPTVLPFLELLSQGQRQPWDFANLQKLTTSLGSMLVSLVNPDLLGNPARGFALNRSLGNFPYYEFASYFGLIPAAFAVTAALRSSQSVWEKSEIQAWTALTVFSLLCAAATPLYRVVIFLLPPLQRALPGRFLIVFIFAGCVLASHGMEIWTRCPKLRQRIAMTIATLSGATLVGIVAMALGLRNDPEAVLKWTQNLAIKIPAPQPGPKYLAAVLSGLWDNYVLNPQLWLTVLAGIVMLKLAKSPTRRMVLVFFVTADLVLFASNFNTTVPVNQLLPMTPSLEFLQRQEGFFRVEKEASAFYNTLTPYGLNLVTGYESVMPKRYADTLTRAEPLGNVKARSIALTDFTSPILSSFNLVYLLQPPLPTLKPPQGWEKVFDNEIRIYKNPKALPRVFVRGQARVFQDFSSALNYLGGPEFNPNMEVVLEHEPPFPIEPAANSSSAKIVSYEAERVVVEASLPAPGVLVLCDTFYPGWRCLDQTGREYAIVPANGTSRGVYLPAGTHQLQFSFKPRSYGLGLKLCFLGLLLALGHLLWQRHRTGK